MDEYDSNISWALGLIESHDCALGMTGSRGVREAFERLHMGEHVFSTYNPRNIIHRIVFTFLLNLATYDPVAVLVQSVGQSGYQTYVRSRIATFSDTLSEIVNCERGPYELVYSDGVSQKQWCEVVPDLLRSATLRMNLCTPKNGLASVYYYLEAVDKAYQASLGLSRLL